MTKLSGQELAQIKVLLRGALAASAPGLVPLVAMVSANAVDVQSVVPLDRFGLAAAFVVLISMGYLLWRGRWWAALPAIASAAASMVYFAFKFIRPLIAYLKANTLDNFGDHVWPLMLLTPHLVLVLLSLTVGLVALKGMTTARALGPRHVSPIAWGVVLLWLLLLAGDVVYQQVGWRYIQSPSDMVVRLCLGKPALKAEAEGYLMKMGPEAVPALLEGMATPDPDMNCLRQQSHQVLLKLGSQAAAPLLKAALGGSIEALTVLGERGERQAAAPLLDHYNDPRRKGSPEYDAVIKQTITKLNPTIRFD